MDRLLSMRVFQKVVDEGGFAAAARALNMSPAVVTRLVADLEDHLGTRLLHRSTRRISLSSAGETYFNRLRTIMQDIDETDLLVRSETRELSGALRILTSPIIATYALAPMIAMFRRAYPNVTPYITVEPFQGDHPRIEDHDVTLLLTPMGFDGDIIVRKIVETEAILVGAPDYLARKGVPTAPGELAAHDTLLFRNPGMVQRAWRLFNSDENDAPIDVPVEPVLWSNHPEALLLACLGGAGITAVPVDLAALYMARGELVRVLPSWIAQRLTIHAALPSRKFMPERTRVFLDFLIGWIREQRSKALSAHLCHDVTHELGAYHSTPPR